MQIRFLGQYKPQIENYGGGRDEKPSVGGENGKILEKPRFVLA
jgi:hypothetical protein